MDNRHLMDECHQIGYYYTMLIKTSKESIKHALEYLVKIPFAKNVLYKITESARGKCIVIFSLHRVLPDSPPSILHPHYMHRTAMTERQAIKQLSYINRKLPFISLADASLCLMGKRPLDRSYAVLIITSPYMLTLKHLSPFLIEQRIPTTLALSTESIIKDQMPWMDEIIYRLCQTKTPELSLSFMDRSFHLRTMQERVAASNHIIQYLSQSSPGMISTRVAQIGETLGDIDMPCTSERMCTKENLEKLSLNPLFSFICAGTSRLPLVNMSNEEAHEELVVAKNVLYSWLRRGLLPIYFSPFGLLKRKQDFIKLMLNEGYQAAINPKKGLCRPGDNMFRLKRLPLAQGLKNFEQFELQGLNDAIDEMLLVTLAREDSQKD